MKGKGAGFVLDILNPVEGISETFHVLRQMSHLDLKQAAMFLFSFIHCGTMTWRAGSVQ